MTEPTTSLDLSLKLKKAGATQGAHWFFTRGWHDAYVDDRGGEPSLECEETLQEHSYEHFASAFTVGEIVAWFADKGLTLILYVDPNMDPGTGSRFSVKYPTTDGWIPEFSDVSLAEAAGQLWLSYLQRYPAQELPA